MSQESQHNTSGEEGSGQWNKALRLHQDLLKLHGVDPGVSRPDVSSSRLLLLLLRFRLVVVVVVVVVVIVVVVLLLLPLLLRLLVCVI